MYNLFITGFLCFVITVCYAGGRFNKTAADVQSVKLVILMYHGFTSGGKESDYVLDIGRFEEDIVYLKKNGFGFVDTNDIISYVEGKRDLPKKCVMITFDDGYLNNYTYAYPVIKKHNIKVVISPIAYYVELYTLNNDTNLSYSHLTETEIKEMHASGFVDFQNHSYNMHSLKTRKGSSKLTNENTQDYIREFYYDLKAAENVIEDITGKKTTAYAYPFGSVSKESQAILKCCGYKMSFGCEEGFNTIKIGESEGLYKLKRFNRSPQRRLSQILGGY